MMRLNKIVRNKTLTSLVFLGLLFFFVQMVSRAHAQIKIPAYEYINTVAGNGTNGYNGNGILAINAELDNPLSVTVDGSGNIYIGDYGCRIRKVTASTGIITTVAGTGTCGYSGDGGLATSAKLNFIQGLALDGNGNIYILQMLTIAVFAKSQY
jgi:hypothetical protein